MRVDWQKAWLSCKEGVHSRGEPQCAQVKHRKRPPELHIVTKTSSGVNQVLVLSIFFIFILLLNYYYYMYDIYKIFLYGQFSLFLFFDFIITYMYDIYKIFLYRHGYLLNEKWTFVIFYFYLCLYNEILWIWNLIFLKYPNMRTRKWEKLVFDHFYFTKICF